MKLKKILLFILIFFFCLVIKNNVNAYVVNEGGQGKYYLEDLPFDDSGETYTSVFFYNGSDASVLCVQVPNDRSLIICDCKYFNAMDLTGGVTYSYYKCSVTLQDGLLVGGKWSSFSDTRLNMSDYKYIGGTGKVYPFYNGSVLSLPDNVSWSDDFFLTYDTVDDVKTNFLYYPIQSKDGVFTDSSGSIGYYSSIDSSVEVSMNVYKYDKTSSSWVYYSTVKRTDNYYIGHVFYNSKDILDNSNRSNVSKLSSERYFKCLYEYSVFPYILNGQEDLSKGGEDVIIMPRGF